MTDSKKYNVAGAEVEITVNVYPQTIGVHITVDLGSLDVDEPDHSPHNLIKYIALPHYSKKQSYWWCKLYRNITVKTGSQARRVIKNALSKIDDAVSQALIDRNARKAHLVGIL